MLKRPTHSAVTQFIASILPPKTNDVPLLYHVPRHPRYNPDNALVEQVVLSITPTPGVYDLIGHPHEGTIVTADESSPIVLPRLPRTICFLHRPFDLERRRVRNGTLVLSSHTSFDEHLTVGWNAALAERLGMSVVKSLCVQGYKADAERKIGILGQVAMLRDLLLRRIKQEFGTIEHVQEGQSDEIRVIAIMNAFNAEEVDRVLDMARARTWIPSEPLYGRHVLYLTGQPRESGMLAAEEHGMTVVCVGHRIAEEWGIRRMATMLRLAFPTLQVREIYEEEIRPDRTPGPSDLSASC
ncbi:hypothetical protein BDV95DRAFT_601400 [Massariosphaeria phaeospora]|uniref:Ngg1p interacting factor 3 nif3 protein n=1 Tax=Massariosphaeria phaeospora TaxID=100035 RepID=A0A7C8IGC8_9PLEO|nr:hypothetical protein BDV95DRAFT_601400 [Massariosphaeria phaeospora]